MDLSEYLWRKKITQRKATKDLKASLRSVHQYTTGETSPSLLSALKIFAYTGAYVGFINMLTKKDLIKLEEYLRNIQITEKNNEIVSDMLHQIKRAHIEKDIGDNSLT